MIKQRRRPRREIVFGATIAHAAATLDAKLAMRRPPRLGETVYAQFGCSTVRCTVLGLTTVQCRSCGLFMNALTMNDGGGDVLICSNNLICEGAAPNGVVGVA